MMVYKTELNTAGFVLDRIHLGNNIVNVHEIVIDATYLYTE